MENKPILVSCAIIRKENKILIAQRKKESLLEPDKWEFPGGKVEHKEHPEDTIVREIEEELGIKIKVDSLFRMNSHVYTVSEKEYHVVILAFLTTHLKGEPKNIDCQDCRWVDPKDILGYDFVEGDKVIASEFIGSLT